MENMQPKRDILIEGFTARLHRDWAADVDAFDQILTEILTVSDALSDGIIKQFPDKFGGKPATTTHMK